MTHMVTQGEIPLISEVCNVMRIRWSINGSICGMWCQCCVIFDGAIDIMNIVNHELCRRACASLAQVVIIIVTVTHQTVL